MPIIETINLTKQYDNLVALDKLNLQVNEGEIFGLLGPNGAGKTTTLMALTSLIKPTSGTAAVNGYDIIKNPAMVRKSIGIVFQDPSSDDILTGYENLKLHGMLYSMPVGLREEKIKEVLNLVDLTDRKDERVKKYSGGMRRRLEIARGLMHRPKVLFLDEPTLGLDPQSRENIWKYIENLSGRGEMSIIITTHYMEEADRLCNRLAITDHGKVVALDSPSNLKKIIGGEVVKMKIKNPDLEAISKLDFVKKIEKINEFIHLTVLNASANLQKILNVAGEVESVEIHTPTLNDVFLHYTGREIREDSPEGGWGQRVMNMRSRK
jgi:ABC-2 type transport system ATP-binding protein